MLSQASGYAATALAHIAHTGRPALVKEVAEATGIPAPYLAKIVQVLARKGIVRTQRGIGGGVTLAHLPNEITLADICLALDDPAMATRCMLGTAECSDERACPAHKFWKAHRTTFHNFLRSTTLDDLQRVNGQLRFKMFMPSESSPRLANLAPGRNTQDA